VDDLTQEFVAETRDMLEHVGNALLEWERDPRATRNFDDIFRFVHTVKGSCGFLDLPRIEKLAHGAESVLSDLRNGDRMSDEAVIGGLLRVIDRITILTAALENGDAVPDEAEDAALLTALVSGIASQASYAAPAPVSPRRRNVRIDVDLLDAMMTQVSDLVLVRNELTRTLRPTLGADATANLLDALSARIGELRGSIAKARMQPVDRLFAALPRLVRDTAFQLGKSVGLVIEGTEVELDREMVEQLRDPLIHIVRNAIDHGIEMPELRSSIGKQAEAELRVTAKQSGNQVVITVSDDGRGIDLAGLRARALSSGMQEASSLSPEASANLIFQPGLSTAESITAISGRGVGMDVVRANIEKLGGTVSLLNKVGAGLTIEICVPLTLSIVTVLTVSAGGMTFAIPRAIVQEVVSIRSDAVTIDPLGAGYLATVRGEKLGALSLSRSLGLNDCDQTHLLIVQPTGGRRYAMLVEAVHDQEEVVVRQVSPQLSGAGVFAGQALPNSGLPILVIDVLGVARLVGLNVDRAEVVPLTLVPAKSPTISVLSFIGLDGQPWGVRTAMVERIEDVARESFTVRAGDAFVVLDGVLVPAVLDGELPATDQIALLRLTDGKINIGYPVLQVDDLVRIDAATVLSPNRHPIAMVAGQVVRLLDQQDLFPTNVVDLEPTRHVG
jgi:two-component system chemotaxis sensor kinase CheA